ncbi:MAG TPA: carboxypeptidase-like regulatory domain-containing protein [Chitinophagaceae bacterium]|nr:carboxypeptidase-like regulatory domain-containing protein [Chitinophagaceae bacterium]
MKKTLLYFFLILFSAPFISKAQFENYKDSVVQLYGVVMSADSLKALPAVSIVVKGRNQGTISSDQGVFDLPVLRGDVIVFTCVGYKPKEYRIPMKLDGNEQSVISLMVQDTVYLPATIIKKRPTREEFERDFVNTKVPEDDQEIARQNLSEKNLRALMAAYPKDGKEATSYYLKQNAQKYYSAGQLPPQNIFNPLAWAEFIKAWKRGDFKNKSDE